uniref:Uncharacterized protein n=1 Tax=Romanomermis culicivorax TaxID=13658 RepID=A0A915L9J7_ROMCU
MRLNGYLSGHGTLEQFEKESPTWGLTNEELGIVREVVKKVFNESPGVIVIGVRAGFCPKISRLFGLASGDQSCYELL